MLNFFVLALVLSVVARTNAIPSGYKNIPGVGSYKMHTTPAPWAKAWKTCRDEGAHLVIVNSLREEIKVMSIYSQHPSIYGAMWIGVHDQFIDNQFETVLGYPLSIAGRINWNTREPNNANGGEHCVSFYRNNGKTNDENCNRALPFMCEI